MPVRGLHIGQFLSPHPGYTPLYGDRGGLLGGLTKQIEGGFERAAQATQLEANREEQRTSRAEQARQFELNRGDSKEQQAGIDRRSDRRMDLEEKKYESRQTEQERRKNLEEQTAIDGLLRELRNRERVGDFDGADEIASQLSRRYGYNVTPPDIDDAPAQQGEPEPDDGSLGGTLLPPDGGNTPSMQVGGAGEDDLQAELEIPEEGQAGPGEQLVEDEGFAFTYPDSVEESGTGTVETPPEAQGDQPPAWVTDYMLGEGVQRQPVRPEKVTLEESLNSRDRNPEGFERARRAAEAIPPHAERQRRKAAGLPTSPLSPGPLGAQAKTSDDIDASEAPPEMPRKGYRVFDKNGREVYSSQMPHSRVVEWQGRTLTNALKKALVDNAATPEEKAAATKAYQYAMGRAGSASTDQIIKEAVEMYESDLQRANNLARSKSGGVGGGPAATGGLGGTAMNLDDAVKLDRVVNATVDDVNSKMGTWFRKGEQEIDRAWANATSSDPARQRQSINELIKSMSGATVSDRERAIYQGMHGKLTALEAEWNNYAKQGAIPPELMASFRSILENSRAQIQEYRRTLGEEVRQKVMSLGSLEYASPEWRKYQADVAASAFTRESVGPPPSIVGKKEEPKGKPAAGAKPGGSKKTGADDGKLTGLL
jgi:hypothetical protein